MLGYSGVVFDTFGYFLILLVTFASFWVILKLWGTLGYNFMYLLVLLVILVLLITCSTFGYFWKFLVIFIILVIFGTFLTWSWKGFEMAGRAGISWKLLDLTGNG